MARHMMGCVQHMTRVVPMTISWSAGTPTLDEGSTFATIADTGTGIVTVTLVDAFARAPVISATPVITTTGDELFCVLRSVAAGSFIVEITDEGGTLTDPTALHLIVVGFDTADEM